MSAPKGVRAFLLECGGPRGWLFFLPTPLVVRLLGRERATRWAVEERERLRSHGLWKESA